MDILLIDPPYTSLKGVGTNRGYHVGLTSLAGYLRSKNIETAVIMGDLLTGISSYDSLKNGNVKVYAAGQRNYESIVNDKSHIIWKKMADLIVQHKPRMIGISYLTPIKCVVERIAELIKETDKDIKVVAGSFHPTFCPDEVMQNPHFDFVIRGEGEIPLSSLFNELKKDNPRWESVPGLCYREKNGQIKINEKADPILNLDELPFLARDLVLNCDYNIYRAHSVYTSRGCPYTCSFCSDRGLWGGKVRRRSVNNVIEECNLIKKTYPKIDFIDIVDGTFTFDRKYVETFCNALISQKINLNWRCTARYDNLNEDLLRLMKKAGCTGLYLGAESGSEKILKTIDKRITVGDILKVSSIVYKSGINSATAILLGLPDETKDDAGQTLDLMRKVKTDILDVNSYVPLPGTQLYTSLSAEDKQKIDWRKIGYKSYDNYFSQKMSQADFVEYRAAAYGIASRLQRKTIMRLGAKMIFSKIVKKLRMAK